MLVPPRRNGLTPLFKEVTVNRVFAPSKRKGF